MQNRTLSPKCMNPSCPVALRQQRVGRAYWFTVLLEGKRSVHACIWLCQHCKHHWKVERFSGEPFVVARTSVRIAR